MTGSTVLLTASKLAAGLHGAAAAETARWTQKKHGSHSNFCAGKVKNMSRAGRSGWPELRGAG
jgi:hypothetical protein